MKEKMKVIIIVLMSVALFTALFPATGFAKDNKTYYTGKECDYDWLTPLEPFVITPMPNSGWQISVTSRHEDTTTDPRVNGIVITPLSGFADANILNGFAHGNFILENEGGSWFGTWVGKMTDGLWSIHGVFRGSGGYEGLVDNFTYQSNPASNCADISGYIIETDSGG